MGVTELMDVIVYLCVNEHVDVNIQWMDEPCMCIFVMYIIYISFHGFFVFLIHLWRHFYKIRVSKGAPLETLVPKMPLQRCTFGDTDFVEASPKVHLWRRVFCSRVSIGGTFGDANLETRLSRVFKGS
jgi:hypothetical protein